ncbi:MAG: energy-coupling factor ABC transporter ATP-binding protein [Thaumarchaeota archaeon]|nr:energy-coupling factor ABC transporter ATP-binding protein [Nitrososphaerota archaeon]
MKEKSIIKFENFSFRYDSANEFILKNINLEINKNELVILAGPTGCGKSTLLRSIIGLIPHMHGGEYKGRVIVDQLVVNDVKITDLAKKAGFVFQNPENQIFMFSIERDIVFGLENLGTSRTIMKERVDSILSLLKIEHLATKAPHELSDGEKQKAALAGILAMQPKILILDEPTSLLDPKTAIDFINIVNDLRKKIGMTIVIVEHRLDLVVGIADKLIILSNGKIIENNNPKQVLHYSNQLIPEIGIPVISRLYRNLAKSNYDFDNVIVTVKDMVKEMRRKKFND